MAQVNLTVNGRVHRVLCEDGQEDHVSELAARFDSAIDELRGAMGEIGDQRLLVMAGILMTDRLDDAERRMARLEQDLRDLRDVRANSAMRIDGMEENFAEILQEAAARIERIAERLTDEPERPEPASG
jgi:cell division protein ZapA